MVASYPWPSGPPISIPTADPRLRRLSTYNKNNRLVAVIVVVAVVLIGGLPSQCSATDSHFRDVSAGVFSNQSGYLAAFADFNSDKAIDVFVLLAPNATSGFRQLDLNQAQNPRFREERFSRTTLLKDFPMKIDSVMSADLNGDRVQDIVLYSREAKTITIFWGTGDYMNKPLNMTNTLKIEHVYVEPLLFDFNGDRIVDIFTSVDDAKHRTVIQCQTNATECTMLALNQSTVNSGLPEIAFPHSNSFVDLNGDLNADLLVSTNEHFEVWLWQTDHSWVKSDNRPYPVRYSKDVGQSVFVDFNSTGKLFHVVQACNPDCNEVYVWMPKSATDVRGSWKKLFKLDGDEKFWRDSAYMSSVNAMMSLKSADFDQDGYPDFLTIVDLPKGGRGMVSLVNHKCGSAKDEICVAGRSFHRVVYPGDFSRLTRITNLGFFDIRENGKIDVLVTQEDQTHGNWSIAALENTYTEDVCFIKVIIVSGLCSKDQCRGKGDTIEYGYNQPGPVAGYTITDSEGKMRSSVAAQLYQTSHGALQLPYILFGIGLSPNFVESLEVRMPGLNSSHQWTQIIPNSQMLVIPHPVDEPGLWQNKLFITPSRKMLHTGLALCAVVLVNLIIVLVLHLMEKKADRIEKQQQAHKFNFDAM